MTIIPKFAKNIFKLLGLISDYAVDELVEMKSTSQALKPIYNQSLVNAITDKLQQVEEADIPASTKVQLKARLEAALAEALNPPAK